MEHLSGHEDLRTTIEAARTMLLGVPDDGAAFRGFDRALAEKLAEHGSAEGIIAKAAQHLRVSLTHHRPCFADELRSRLLQRSHLDGMDRVKVSRAALVAMRQELQRAADSKPSANDLFLRTTTGGDWSTWTQHLLDRHDLTSSAGVTNVYDHPALTQQEIQRLHDNDTEMWQQVIDTFQDTVRNIARRHKVPEGDVDQVVNNTFTKAMRSIATFRGQYGESIYAWLATAADSTARDFGRTKRRQRKRERPASEMLDERNVDSRQLVGIGSEAPVEDSALAFESLEIDRLSAAVTQVINLHLAPAPVGLASVLGESEDSELPEWLASPELKVRRTKRADGRFVLAAAINLLITVARADDADAQRMLKALDLERGDSRARDAIRVARVVAGKGDADDALAHRARISAPSVLYAARHALRAWLETNPVEASLHSDERYLWRGIWLIERSFLIEELEAISVQFTGSLNRLNETRIQAFSAWSSEILEDLAPALQSRPEDTADASWPGPRDHDLERKLQATIRGTLRALVDIFEQGPTPLIDAKTNALRECDPDTHAYAALSASIDHYHRLGEVLTGRSHMSSRTATRARREPPPE